MAFLSRGCARSAGLALFCAALLLLRAGALNAQGDTLEEEVKAAFLYNFTKYVDWPSSAFVNPEDPFRLCVIASDEFTGAVKMLIQGETARGRPLHLLRPTISQVRLCHILFIGSTETRAAAVLAAARARPILTVGEAPGFLDEGGAILFAVEQRRVRFDVDLSVTRQAGLSVSSKLLRVARKVRGDQSS